MEYKSLIIIIVELLSELYFLQILTFFMITTTSNVKLLLFALYQNLIQNLWFSVSFCVTQNSFEPKYHQNDLFVCDEMSKTSCKAQKFYAIAVCQDTKNVKTLYR